MALAGSALSFLPLALATAAASAVLLATRVVPRWIAWVGLVSALAQLGGLGDVFDAGGPLALVAFGGALLQLLWVLATSVSLLRHPGSSGRQQQVGVGLAVTTSGR